MAGDDPRGTDHGVMVGQDEPDRILRTQEAVAENGDEAKPLLQPLKDLGLTVTAAFSDDSHSFTESIKAVYPQARLQADHCQTVKQVWGHLTKSLSASRRRIKAKGDAKHDQAGMELAKPLWPLPWRLLKQPPQGSAEEKPASAALESTQEGVGPRFRSLSRPLGHLFAPAPSPAQATSSWLQLRQALRAVHDEPLAKRLPCLADPWEPAWRSLRQKGMGPHRRGANSASGMRLSRRREKPPDGLRSAVTRQPYMQSYQAIKDLSLDIAELIAKGPQMTGLPRV
jgi:hypothetical protein